MSALPLQQESLERESRSREPVASERAPMFELIPYEKFRDTPAVRFFDITVAESNARDLVIHAGPAVSPPDEENTGAWQFYLHPHQEDNLLALHGGRTFYLVNFGFMLLFLATGSRPERPLVVAEHLSWKIGIVVVVLGVMHMLNLLILNGLRSGGMKSAPPPVPPRY